MIKSNKKCVWALAGGAAIVVLVVAGVYAIQLKEKKSEQTLRQSVIDKTVEYINANLLAPGTTASLASITEESGIYKLKVKIGENEPEVYVTKNGKLLFIQGVIDMTPATTTENQTGEETSKATCETLTKAEKPVLEAFVVAGCPFGLQMQRVLAEIVKNIPLMAANIKVEYIGAISNGKITSMHGDEEAQENLKQICIREEQSNKYWDYVGCYMQEGKSTACLATSKIDTAKLNACMTDSDKGIKYAAVDFAAQDAYGVSGSPTLFLNGKKVSEFDFGGRTAEAAKTLICCGAKTQPSACSQALSTESAATSFSKTYSSAAGSNNSASCGQ